MSQVLYLKWRPLSWEEVIGQEHVITTLRNAVRRDRVSHAQLFSGPRGTGKTTTARLLAKAVNCLAEDVDQRPCNGCAHCQAVNQGEFLDLIEIDAASNTSVEDVRDLRDKINFSPNQGKYKVYIIDEVHMLSTAAFNALLKTLEEPPEHAIFVLATTEVHKIPATVLSRCQRHEFRRIPVRDIQGQLRRMVEAEDIEADEDALRLISRQATGSLRDAISILDQLASLEGAITIELVHRVLGTTADQAVLDLVDAVLDGNPSRGLTTLGATQEKGSNPRQLGRQVVSHLRNLLLYQMGNQEEVDVPEEVAAALARQGARVSVSQLLELIKIFNQAAGEKSSSWLPMLPLEMAFVDGLRVMQEGKGSPAPDGGGTARSEGNREPEPQSQQAAGPGPTSGPARVESEASPVVSPAEEGRGEGQVNILRLWKEITKLVRGSNPTTQALLNTCQPLGIRDGALVLSFRSDINKTKMEKEDHLRVCQQVIEEVVGEKLSIQCVLGKGEDSDLPQDVDPDGLVATAVRDLGGRYVADEE